MPALILVDAAIAAVWMYEGLWCKVLRRSAHERAVVEAAPLFGPHLAAV